MKPTVLSGIIAMALTVTLLVAGLPGYAHSDGRGTGGIAYSHYKVIDRGCFGGPTSHIHLGAHVLNNILNRQSPNLKSLLRRP
jgi:hypothetical protein